jgi:hypothetical protein
MRKKNQFDPNHGRVVSEEEPASPAPPPAPKVEKTTKKK